MTARPHYHRCSECPSPVLCTKQGDHDEPTCIKCRRQLRENIAHIRRLSAELYARMYPL